MRLFPALALTLAAGTAAANPAQWVRDWPITDFSRSTVGFAEVISGGAPKDGIPSIQEPDFRPAAEETRLDDREPVLSHGHDGEAARAYPVRYLMWHEIVNDVVGGLPVAVTFCPLCNSAMVFDARVDGIALRFGVSGLLRHSDMIMYDRETESWWQQAVGEGVVGVHAGTRLTTLPAWMESWAEFRARKRRADVIGVRAFLRTTGSRALTPRQRGHHRSGGLRGPTGATVPLHRRRAHAGGQRRMDRGAALHEP